MPLTIEIGCDGKFHVTSDNDIRNRGSPVTVKAKDLAAVHLAVDHHYRDYMKGDPGHEAGAVEGCPFCKKRRS